MEDPDALIQDGDALKFKTVTSDLSLEYTQLRQGRRSWGRSRARMTSPKRVEGRPETALHVVQKPSLALRARVVGQDLLEIVDARERNTAQSSVGNPEQLSVLGVFTEVVPSETRHALPRRPHAAAKRAPAGVVGVEGSRRRVVRQRDKRTSAAGVLVTDTSLTLKIG